MSEPLRCLIWDVDGTLADTEDAHRHAFNEAFAAAGADWHWDRSLYRQLLKIGGGKERLRHWLAETHPQGANLDDMVRRIHADKTTRFQTRLETGAVPLRPGVARVIAEARAAGIVQAIATTTHRGNVDALLGRALGPDAVNGFIIAAADQVARKKPAPDVYLWLLERLKIPAAACLAIEDSVIGLASARAAEIATVVTVNPWTEGDDFTGALAVLDHLGDPDHPCRALADGSGWVDVGLLRAWHGRSVP